MTIVPAYGRDYKSKKAALADWQAGKDFRIVGYRSEGGGTYVSIRDRATIEGSIQIRYYKLQRVVIV